MLLDTSRVNNLVQASSLACNESVCAEELDHAGALLGHLLLCVAEGKTSTFSAPTTSVAILTKHGQALLE